MKSTDLFHKLLPILLGSCLVSATAWAQEDSDLLDASDVAKALSNPNATMGFMAFNLDYISYDGDLPGAGSESAQKLTFQPSFPYPLSDSTNFFVRPLVPIYP